MSSSLTTRSALSGMLVPVGRFCRFAAEVVRQLFWRPFQWR